MATTAVIGAVYYKSSNVLELLGLKNAVSGAYLNAATVNATVYRDGAAVPGQTWPLVLTYEAASNGNYRGTIEDTIEVQVNDLLEVIVTVNGGAGLVRRFRVWARVEEG